MLKLLIAEDMINISKGITDLISHNTFALEIIGVASNGLDALSLAKSSAPDIIITDIRMPKLDGVKLAFEIRKLYPMCQIIFISGYSDKDYLKSAISLKAVSYVEKPINSDELLDAVKAAIHIVEENTQKQDIIKQNQFLRDYQRDILCKKMALSFFTPNMDATLWEQLRPLCTDFCNAPYYCTLICQLNLNDASENTLENAYDQIRNQFVNHNIAFLSVEKKPGTFVIHIGDARLHPSTYHDMLNFLYTEIRCILADPAEIYFAVGNVVQTPDQLYYSYINAVINLRNLFFLGYNNICFSQNTETAVHQTFESNRTSCITDSAFFQKYENSLKLGNTKETSVLITVLFSQLRQNHYLFFEVNSIKNMYYQLLLIMENICKEQGIQNVFSPKKDYVWETLSKMDTIFALQDYLLCKLNLFAEELVGKSETSLLVFRIKQYIELHYPETDLSINKMSDSLYFTPSYLCQIFKKETGITINTYINTFRISTAKELLKDPALKLYEIACMVGYNNPDNFTKQFKKQTGITPSDFKEKYSR